MITSKSSTVLASAQFVYNWHTKDTAFQRLIPPWESVKVLNKQGTFDSLNVTLQMKRFGIPIRWVAEHFNVVQGEQFIDRQLKGPFKSWVHSHLFESMADNRTKMTDQIEFKLPLLASNFLSNWQVEKDLQRMLYYRHQQVCGDCEILHGLPMEPQTIAISGASGLIGSQLELFLTTAGHRVKRLVRSKKPLKHSTNLAWDPNKGILDDYSDVTIIVHLAGESIAAPIRWTRSKKQKIYHSRVDGTSVLCNQLADAPHSVHTFICGSAVGIYPDSNDIMVESSESGDDFLSRVVVDWEAACDPIRSKIRVCHARFGAVLHPNGGMMKRLLPLMKLGMLGPIGSGNQFFSWVSLDDAVRAVYHLMADTSFEGPANIVSPNPQTQRNFMTDWGRAFFRPTKIPLPKPIVKYGMGEMGNQLLLRSSRVMPNVLTSKRFHFQCMTIKDLCMLYFK